MNAEELATRLRMLCQFFRFNVECARRVSLLHRNINAANRALSIRTCATMFPPSSATAMFMGWPISLAFFSAALITRRASSNFTAVINFSFSFVRRQPELFLLRSRSLPPGFRRSLLDSVGDFFRVRKHWYVVGG